MIRIFIAIMLMAFAVALQPEQPTLIGMVLWIGIWTVAIGLIVWAKYDYDDRTYWAKLRGKL